MNSEVYSDETLKKYLLGEISDEERYQIEQRYVADKDFLDQLLAVEDDLVDEYVQGELDATEREQFEQKLLVTPKQRRKVRQAQILLEAIPAHGRPAPHENIARRRSSTVSWMGWFGPRWLPAFAGALALLILLVGTAWLFIRRQHSKELQTKSSSMNSNSDASSQTQFEPTPVPDQSAKIVIALNDAGTQVTLNDAGDISGLGELSPADSKSVKDALKTQQLRVPPVAEGLKQEQGTLMGSSGDGTPFGLVEPLGTVVRSDRPTFRWQALAGAASYIVKVYDSNFKEVATSGRQTNQTWRAVSPLPRGAIYSWQVTAYQDDEEIRSPTRPAPEARFQLLSSAQAKQLDNAQRTHGDSHLLLGVLYAEAGLLPDAQNEFRLLLKSNPGSPVVQGLLRAVSK